MPDTKNNAPTTEVDQGAKGISQAFDSAPPVPAEQAKRLVTASAQAEKDFSTVRAEAALANTTVQRMEDEGGNFSYLVSRWSWSRTCATLDEVRALVHRIAGVSR